MSKPECVDCAALPATLLELIERGLPDDSPRRPATPRPIVSGVRKPRCATHHRARQLAKRARTHESRVKRVYGLTDGEYAELLAAQGGTCAFPRCNASGKRKRLAVDHDHDTGEVRGLLCGPHNYQLVGKFAGDLRDALTYLADPPARRLRGVS